MNALINEADFARLKALGIEMSPPMRENGAFYINPNIPDGYKMVDIPAYSTLPTLLERLEIIQQKVDATLVDKRAKGE